MQVVFSLIKNMIELPLSFAMRSTIIFWQQRGFSILLQYKIFSEKQYDQHKEIQKSLYVFFVPILYSVRTTHKFCLNETTFLR